MNTAPQHTHFLVVPAVTEVAGQLRIVSRRTDTPAATDDAKMGALASYRRDPDLWAEAGLVNAQGDLVCLDADPFTQDEIRESQPLMAGYSFTFKD